jgi:membrane-bound metal-dependent hydrolase YbcI (DUF457 family)
MNRKGHVGMTLLAFAPVVYLLASDGKLLLAVLGWLGIQAVEPLPDQDFHLPFLNHRGLSHSLVAVLVVGGVFGAGGWFLGDRLFDLLYAVFSTGAGLWGWVLNQLPDLSASVLAGIVPNIPPGEIVATIQQQAGSSAGRRGFAVFGFFVGAYGVLAHLLGDVITEQGIKPFLPISRWQLSLSSLRAESPVANSALFGLGVLAIVAVLVATVPGAVFGAGIPADLSPVGVAGAQDSGANNSSGQNTTSTAQTVEIRNQTNSGDTVTVRRATLSQPGFVAIHTSSYADGLVGPNESIIAVSQRLAAGTHHNVTVDVSNAPPGNAPGLNRSQLNQTTTLGATVYGDTNDNVRLDSVRSLGENDTLVTTNGSVVRDSARVRVPSPPRQTASVAVENQTLDSGTLTVEQARLPDGGFLVVRNESYRQTGDSLTSVAATSKYLEPGNHTNVTLDVRPGALRRVQVVTVQPARDTNNNQQYDFVRSGGFQDVAYETLNRSDTIKDTARVRAPGSGQTVQPASSTLEQPATTVSPQTTASGDVEGSNSFLGLSSLQLLAGGLVVLVVLPTLIGKLR